MNIPCPSCRSTISTDDINVATDVALCRNCGKAFSFSEILGGSAAAAVDLSRPPSGAWFEQTADGFRTGATTRTWRALFLVPFICVWSGMSLSGIYGHQIMSGHFDPSSSLFGLPFLFGSFALVAMCAMDIAGKTEIVQSGDRVSIFVGVGPLGWTRNYQRSDFSVVREDYPRKPSLQWNRSWNGQINKFIILEGKRRASFGSLLSDERRYFVLSVLKKMLVYGSRDQSIVTTSPFR